MNKTVVVDVDGVLADFESAFCSEFGSDRRELESLESRYPSRNRGIRQFVSDPFTYKTLLPIQLGIDVVNCLVAAEYDVHIISSRPLDKGVTRDWLKRWRVQYSYFGVHPNKTAYIGQMQPVVAVDDLISVARGLKRYNVPVLLMKHPWNSHYEDKSAIFSNIQEFIAKINKIVQEKENK